MTVPASVDWEQPQTVRWLVALALSCVLHGALVWEGFRLVRPERFREGQFFIRLFPQFVYGSQAYA